MTARVYLDASLLVAMFTVDALTIRADRFLRRKGATFVLGTFGCAEFSSAVGRKVRMGTMTTADAAEVFSTFDSWVATGPERVDLTGGDVEKADWFLRWFDLKLRAGDALHLAAALRLGLPVATFDTGMARAAVMIGLTLAPC